MATSGQRLKNVLKSAALLPARAVKGSSHLGNFGVGGSHRNAFTPVPGESPLVILRLQVIGCMGLLPKDRNGLSDPFVVVSLLHAKCTTPTCKRTLNPVFPARESTFEFPIYMSVVERMGGVGVIELLVWDRDMLVKKEYLGEVGVGVDSWFPLDTSEKEGERALAWDDIANKPFSFALESARANTAATGSIQVKLGFVSPPNTANLMDFEEVFRELRKKERTGRSSWASAPPTKGVGTIRSNRAEGPPTVYEDDGGLSSAEEYEPDEEGEGDFEGSEVEGEGEFDEGGEEERERVRAAAKKLTVELESPTTPTAVSNGTIPGTAKATSSGKFPSPTPATAMPLSLAKMLAPSPPPPVSVPSPNSEKAVVIPKSASPVSLSTTVGSTLAPLSPSAPAPAAPPLTGTKSSTGFIPKLMFPRKKTGASNASASNSRSPSVSPTSSSISTTGGESAAEGAVKSTTGADGDEKEKGKDKLKRRFKRWSTGSSSAPTLTPIPITPGPAFVTGEVGVRLGEPDVAGAQGGASGSDGSSAAAPHLTPTAASKDKKDFMFKASNDIVGIVMLEIVGAENLPRLKNMTRTGWDMDPFVVISFGKKVFRTRVIRHTLNPEWDEKLLFHVRRYETAFQVQLTILDWDKLSSNDLVGDASFDVKVLVETAPQPDPVTGLYAPDCGGDHPMKEMKLGLAGDIPWELTQGAKPTITIRAKYQSYAALRQRFWRQYLRQYDTDDTGEISLVELTSMLDSLGSTLTKSTIASFFERYGKSMEDELTVDEAIQCLEKELCRPLSEKNRVDVPEDGNANGSSISVTPILTVMDRMGKELVGGASLALDQLDFSGPTHSHARLGSEVSGEDSHVPYVGVEGVDGQKIVTPSYPTEPSQVPLRYLVNQAVAGAPIVVVDSSEDDPEEEGGTSSGTGGSLSIGMSGTSGATTDSERVPKKSRFRQMRRKKTKRSSVTSTPTGTSNPSLNTLASEGAVERVINVKNCPLCHRPRLNSKGEMDIVTHLAVCASQDWNQIDRIMVGNFVTASQAQRKWYTNMLGKISAGGYGLGANSANIIVQNRITGQLEEEKMQVYVKLGIRLLYKGAKGRMEGSRARRLLKSLSIKQGIKYDSPESAKEIPSFIQFHRLNLDEILDPIESFKTFNEFFYRKLKPDARPVEEPDDPYRLVSGADCRLMTFETVSEATKIWIKGREFSVARLLGDAYKDEAEKYAGGALGIFRLAPQDYHRFHSPVDGTVGSMTYIAGEYYTVNPQAIRTALDVYGENARKIVPIDSPQFGRVMAVCVGAMMVGTIKATVEEGQQVRRGQEFGYFAFGGSTIVLLFEKGVLEWDEDLLINGRASLETLVRVGMGVGRGRRPTAS
ncbi:hypothetical protein AX15_003424 [Amanita polypyramis BW_CC]|nr:hypothetical protein AX15_003424 [Amanita polypyramis BW_CC]